MKSARFTATTASNWHVKCPPFCCERSFKQLRSLTLLLLLAAATAVAITCSIGPWLGSVLSYASGSPGMFTVFEAVIKALQQHLA